MAIRHLSGFLSFFFVFLFTYQSSSQVDFSWSQNQGLTVVFTITQAGQFYEAHKWDFGDGTVRYGSHIDSNTYAQTGTYQVCVWGYPMPPAPIDSICKTVEVISLNTDNSDFGIGTYTVFPQPAIKSFSISYNEESLRPEKIRIFMLNGKCVYSEKIISNSGDDILNMDMPEQTLPGIYILQLQNNTKTHNLRLIIL